jgi:hypothetical protein
MLNPKEINMPRTVFLYMLLISLFIAGCIPFARPVPLKTPIPEPHPTDQPSFDGNWTIKMKHSGGIMGLSRSIEISSSGKFTVVDERANKTVTGILAENELSKINEQVSSLEYIPTSKPDGMGCADCFIYDLEIQENGKKFAVQLNDISLPNSELESLVPYLRDMIDITLKK